MRVAPRSRIEPEHLFSPRAGVRLGLAEPLSAIKVAGANYLHHVPGRAGVNVTAGRSPSCDGIRSSLVSVHLAKAMCEGQSAVAVELAEVAATGRLAIYAGAGLSRSSPTAMPSGAEVAQRCYARLVDLLGPDSLSGAEPGDLVSVADAVESHGQDANHVRRTAVGVADFTSARPNFGHGVLALLILEGVVVVITTNWDDCIERAGGDERVQAVISDQDRLEVEGPAILKVHGCATRPRTVLVTTSDLEAPPHWARDEVNARLSDSHTVFVGIGDIAGYMRKRIEEAEQAIGAEGSVFVVAPSIDETWEESQWAEVLPNLADRCRIAMTSDEFLDDLAGALVRRILRGISEDLMEDPAIRDRFERSRTAFEQQGSIEALRWLRCCATPRMPGTSVVREQAFSTALIALGTLSEGATVDFFPRRAGHSRRGRIRGPHHERNFNSVPIAPRSRRSIDTLASRRS